MISQENIESLINGFIEKYKIHNVVVTNWREPIFGIANAKDPLFTQLKQVAYQNHKLPNELLKGAKTVISYFIPFNEEVVLSNTTERNASLEWAIAYIETNKLIVKLNNYLSSRFKQDNYKSFEIPPTHNFDKIDLMSYWSHKHVAYIAGLGKFGLHKMLITEKGCCGRLGSLITSLEIEATSRNEKEFCLYFFNKSCKQCIEKCVFDALHSNKFDRKKCYNICLENGKLHSKLGLCDVCGKCACGVPCSVRNPV